MKRDWPDPRVGGGTAAVGRGGMSAWRWSVGEFKMNIEFSIAPSAKKRIKWLVDELKRKKGIADVIPAVMWIDAQVNCDIEVSGPAIGFYDNRDAIVEDISVVGCFEFVLAIPSECEPIFDGKVLHYLNDRFVLK